MKHSVSAFRGMNNALSPRLISNEQAQKATNCIVRNGNLTPLKGNDNVTPMPSIANNAKTIFLYRGSHWFSWPLDVDVVDSPIAEDQYDRAYYTGDGVPRYTNSSIATGAGVQPFANNTLGLDYPDAFSASVTYHDQSNDLNGRDPNDFDSEPESGYLNLETDDDETRFYVCTYVTDFGEESAPSVVSQELNIFCEDDSVTLTFSDTGGFGTQKISRRRIYRSATSSDVTQFFLVDELPVSTDTYTDTKSVYELGAELETEEYTKPPENMMGLIATSNGVVIGFVGNTVVPSEPYLPYAYPLAYRQTLQDKIVAMAEMSSGVVIATEDKPVIMQGTLPDSFTMTVIDAALPCVSKRSMVDMGEAAIYASHEGLVSISQSGAQLITKDLLSEDYWQSFDPSTVQGYRYNEFYVGFYGGTAGFVFDLRRGDFFELDFYADAGYFDSANGTLYLMVDNELVKFDEGSVLNYEWVSKQFDINAITFSCMKVFAPNLSATNVILHVDGEQLASIPLVGADPFVRLPAFRGSRLHIELSGSDEIESIALATSPGELNG
ncbi:MAG: hypothetical protein CMP19_10420 [Rickettsiales bacterium]|nr:hypothetical protein [Rickettsiales bacterium]